MEALIGRHISLIPLIAEHKTVLQQISDNDSIFTFTSHNPAGNNFDSWWEEVWDLHCSGKQIVFVISRNAGGQIIGNTRFYDFSPKNYRLAVGYTWYIPEVWGIGYNTEVKYLMFKYAFEVMAVNRIELYTSHNNLRSQRAILKLGAKHEGILRSHSVGHNGEARDSYLYSVIRSEWDNNVEAKLMSRLKQLNI